MPKSRLELCYVCPTETTLELRRLRTIPDVWFELLGSAEASIEVEQLYIAACGGTLADELISIIEERAKQHVRVRVIVDEEFFAKSAAEGNAEYHETIDRLKAIKGVRVKYIPFRRLTHGAQHAKYLVVDRRVAWIGSANFDWRSFEHIFEIGVRIEHPDLVGSLCSIFDMDWSLADGASVPIHEASSGGEWHRIGYNDQRHLAKIVATPQSLLPFDNGFELPYLLSAIASAKTTLSLQLRRYTTLPREASGGAWTVVDDALHRAAARGVHVRIILDHRSSMDPAHSVATRGLSDQANIEVRLISVPISSAGHIPYARMFHAKALTVDSKVTWIGSGNWGPDDFNSSRNVGLIVKGRAFARDVEDMFETCWDSTYITRI